MFSAGESMANRNYWHAHIRDAGYFVCRRFKTIRERTNMAAATAMYTVMAPAAGNALGLLLIG